MTQDAYDNFTHILKNLSERSFKKVTKAFRGVMQAEIDRLDTTWHLEPDDDLSILKIQKNCYEKIRNLFDNLLHPPEEEEEAEEVSET